MHVAVVLTAGPPKDLGLIMAERRSRSLVKLPGRTLLEHIVRSVARMVDSVVVAYDDGRVAGVCEAAGCRAVAVEPRGAVSSLCQAFSQLRLEDDDLVTVVYGDIYGEEELYRGHASEAERELEPLMTVVRPVIVRGSYLRVAVDEEGRVAAVGQGDYVYAGLLSAQARVLRRVCEAGSLEAVLDELASRGRLVARAWLGVWVDLDTPWDYMVAVNYELSRLKGLHVSGEARISERAELEPPAVVEAGARIDANAVVRGPVYVGRGALVGAFSFVREATMVLDSSVVGAYSEVKRSVLCEGSYVGSHSYVADSVIGERASLAPYTVTRNLPYAELPEPARVLLTTTHPLERLKVGAVVAAGARTRPHAVLEPAELYGG